MESRKKDKYKIPSVSKLNRNGFRQSVNNAHELRTGMHIKEVLQPTS